ncbi:DarT1-associated NADAR antitoxin family protein [Clostridium sp. CTA-5]
MSTKRVFRIINDREIESVDIEVDEVARASYKEKQNYVRILHKKFNDIYKNEKVLEISTKAPVDLGKKLSAFNLEYEIKNNKYFLECVFQSSKIFKTGGPYKDFLLMEPVEVKRDKRLRNSGELVGFRLEGIDYPLEPKTLFYDWIYVNTLYKQPNLYKKIIEYNAFTDIEFNPQRAINCQAKSVALFVSLYKRRLIEQALSDIDIFKQYV